ncbi:MAG: hypothetical protein ACD_60C00132G0016 [uncultured bacterium]|nr:MAG: hypothetical protein ACD_60C00132G0016 [uncultured bacterium]
MTLEQVLIEKRILPKNIFETCDTQSRNREYPLFPLICMIFLTMDLLSYLYVYYIIGIFHFIVSCSVFFFTTTYIISDIIVEVYGYSCARRIIWFSLICEGIFSACIYILGNVHFNNIEFNNQANSILSKNIFRIFLTSLITTPVGDFVNSFAISRWKILLNGKYFILRSIFATSLGIIVYCLLTQTMLFYGILSFKHLALLIGSSIMFKILFVTICAIPATLIMFFLKKFEKSDPYDFGINYNPFKLI